MSDTTYITEKRTCDVHEYEKGEPGVTASYDAKTKTGQWANVCEQCFNTHTAGVLGTGKGQRLVMGEPPTRDMRAEVRAAVESGDFSAFMDAMGDRDPAEFL